MCGVCVGECLWVCVMGVCVVCVVCVYACGVFGYCMCVCGFGVCASVWCVCVVTV